MQFKFLNSVKMKNSLKVIQKGTGITKKTLTDRKTSNGYQRRADVEDPLSILIEGYENTFNK